MMRRSLLALLILAPLPALAAGLTTRWALKARPPQPD